MGKTIVDGIKEVYAFFIGLYNVYELKIIFWAGLCGSFVAEALGGFDKQLKVLFFFMLIDYITGLYAAWREKDLLSKKSFRGILKKASVLGVVAFCVGVDAMLKTDIVRYAAIAGFGIMEALSIIENADRAGWGDIFPLWIREKLSDVKKNKNLA